MHYKLEILWAFFILGQLLHIFQRAHFVVGSKYNSLSTYREFFKFFWFTLTLRFILCSAIYSVWVGTPNLLKDASAVLGVPNLFPLSPGSSLIFGYFSDSMLDWISKSIPFLKTDAPSSNLPEVKP